MTWLALLQTLFDSGAERYARDIAPALAPLTADFITYAAPSPADRALDLGTGTGSAARLLAPHVRRVVGIDLSPGSLRIANLASPPGPFSNSVGEGDADRRSDGVEAARYVRADLHRLPFRAGSFTLAVASFGLNATDPGRALRAIRRVLTPGGRLAIQEWGPASLFLRALDDLLAGYAVENPAPPLAALRAALDDHPLLWSDHLQDADDYREWLAEAGFAVEEAAESAPLAISLTPEQAFAFWLARADRFEEVRALNDTARAEFFAAARAQLAAFALPDGRLAWEPIVFRVKASW